MAWTSIIESGDTVATPFGEGTVRAISQSNGTAQVNVDGQMYEVSLNAISKSEGQPTPGEQPGKGEGDEVKPGTPANPNTIKEGDRVQRTENRQQKGEVTEVTQRSVKGKWDDGKSFAYPKKFIDQHLEKEQGGKDEQPDEKKKEEREPEQVAKDTADDLYGLLNLKKKLEEKIDNEVEGEIAQLRELAKKNQKLEVKVGDKVNVVPGLKHKQLEQLINYAALRLSPLLVGMAGTGKTHAGEQTSIALGLEFYSMSVGAQTSKSDIIGYMAANGQYVSTHFRKAYEEGGVFLMDEIDAGNANVLIQINAALSNGLCAFPDKMVKRHEDFVFIASANTFGNGANRQYVGRNQLDAATLDRFAVIEWFIDDELESQLTTGINGKAWYMAVRAARDYVAEKNIRALISPRATQKGSKLLHVGQDLKEVIHATMLGSVPDDKKQDVEQIATSIFNKFASEVPGQLPKEINPEAEVKDLFKPAVF